MAEARRRLTGTVKWFSAQKGFGFISPEDGGDDLFVHQTSIRSDGFRTLSDGQPVEFSLEVAQDGRSKAVDVVPRSLRLREPSGRGGFYGVRGRGGGGGGYGRGGRGGGGVFSSNARGGYGGGGVGGGGSCYNCGRFGHLARDCFQGGGGGGRRYGGRGGGSGGGGCYNCGEEGHFARDCPNIDNK